MTKACTNWCDVCHNRLYSHALFRGCSNINISKLLVIDQTEALWLAAVWIINTTTSAIPFPPTRGTLANTEISPCSKNKITPKTVLSFEVIKSGWRVLYCLALLSSGVFICCSMLHNRVKWYDIQLSYVVLGKMACHWYDTQEKEEIHHTSGFLMKSTSAVLEQIP